MSRIGKIYNNRKHYQFSNSNLGKNSGRFYQSDEKLKCEGRITFMRSNELLKVPPEIRLYGSV